ncbi:MAG: DNA polymerase/3'-5' exonuclease PolX [Sphaerobacteraceae bacterium]|nr:MAG: DNA polymerase/3'-5' exonuclease PolX [Sphaerobacteraceae bacterium]
MTNAEVSEVLKQFADLLDIKGESGFRVAAYRRSADTIKRLEEPVATLVDEERLTDLKGIGKGLAANITEIVRTGELEEMTIVQDEVPETLLTILAIPGIGPKSVGLFYRELGITNLEQLEQAIESGQLIELKGIGKKQESRITEGISFLRQRSGKMSIGTALPAARRLSQLLAAALETRAEIVGSVRRRAEVVGNVDLLLEGEDHDRIASTIESAWDGVEAIEHGEQTVDVTVSRIGHVRVISSPAGSFGGTLVQSTGSQDHVESLNIDGRKSFVDESSLYQSVECSWIPPELRENRGEIELARQNSLPDLVELGLIRGDLHLHSVWSDGRATIPELAERAIELGYAYLSIADHSHGLAIANGLNADRLEQQRREIETVRESFPDLHILCASEVEVRRDGSLDFPDDVLEQLDLVVASLHSGRNMPTGEMTSRILSAIENPHVDIIAHPTGRIVEQRPGASYDWDTVFEAAARTKTALEINANPARLDLPEDLARQAVEAGVLIAIDSDAHDLQGLDVMEYGVGIARRGWVETDSVVNTWTLDDLLDWLGR